MPQVAVLANHRQRRVVDLAVGVGQLVQWLLEVSGELRAPFDEGALDCRIAPADEQGMVTRVKADPRGASELCELGRVEERVCRQVDKRSEQLIAPPVDLEAGGEFEAS